MKPDRIFVPLFGALSLLAAPAGAAAAALEQLLVEPSPLAFGSAHESRRVLVTGVTPAGERVDLSETARFEGLEPLVALKEDGYLVARQPGSGLVRVTARGLSVELPVTVEEPESPGHVSFVRDVLPVMNKVGCSAGTCHGAAKGKNGFKLSLRGYDPDFDYQALLYDVSGRRFNRAAPARSLLLAKPSMQVAHVGGLQIEHGSRYYDLILRWISEGVPYGDRQADGVERLEVLPEEVFMPSPGDRQRVVVMARLRDGTSRDVTREAHFTSSNTEAFGVDDRAVVSGVRRGEGALLVRYEGKFATVPVTILDRIAGFRWRPLPQHNYIDSLIDEKLERIEVQPSAAAEDGEFLRRVSLDLTGRIPDPAAVRAFLDDPTEARSKRERLIDELIGSEAFVDHWTLKWGDLLRSNRKYLSYKGVWTFNEWLRDALRDNVPYDRFVRELVTARGSTFESPAANYFRAARTPQEAMETTTQLFLGVRMVCAQCHDHPFERWTQEQYFEMAAFFAGLAIRPGFQSGEEVVFQRRQDAEMKHPKLGHTVQPAYMVSVAGAPEPTVGEDRREAVAAWLTSPENPFFARAIANRIWSYFMGRGIIDPVDDIRDSNPPVNPALLDALTRDLIAHDFDLQHLMRTIVRSRAYQSSFRSDESSRDDTINFSHRRPRRLAAEQLASAISVATGVTFEVAALPEDFQPTQLPDPHVGLDGFLDLFGRPQRESACECERETEMSLPQALTLLNGPLVGEAIADPDGRVARLVLAGASDGELIEELYLAALSRYPSAGELTLATERFAAGDSRTAAAQDLLWALVNSNAFLFNL